MREYRTRLISDVVTGKIDVRDIQVPETAEELPEIEEASGEDNLLEEEEEVEVSE